MFASVWACASTGMSKCVREHVDVRVQSRRGVGHMCKGCTEGRWGCHGLCDRGRPGAGGTGGRRGGVWAVRGPRPRSLE